MPWAGDSEDWIWVYFGDEGGDGPYAFQVCPDHGEVVCEFEGYASRGCSRCLLEYQQVEHHPRIVAALDAGCTARAACSGT